MSEGGVIGKLARGLSARSGVLSAWIGVNDAAVADALARESFDAVTLDMQHGGVDFVGAARSILAVALAGKPTIARIPVGDFAGASRLVDAGAAAVIAPMINSAEDARRFAEFMKFPPLGRRSWGPRAALALTGLIGPAYLHSANAMTLAIAMIETREALEALDDILGTPGIDGVFVGPSDLSIALNRGAVVDPHGADVEAALSRIAERAHAHGKFAGLFCLDGARAKAALARGFGLCSVSTDLILLRAAARLELAAAR
ncbi:MAG: aldolase/citrate lyase family protein [Roseiarcus sp.]|jgi:4-hydroxy-2-oxoheptanedioate aldolase